MAKMTSEQKANVDAMIDAAVESGEGYEHDRAAGQPEGRDALNRLAEHIHEQVPAEIRWSAYDRVLEARDALDD